MKTKFLLFLATFLCFFYSFAQIPSGYYDTATGTGYTLKTQLHDIIDSHTDKGYSGLWTTYATSDRDNQYENDNTIIDMYSENPTGTDPYNFTYSTDQCGSYSSEGDCYNREHIVPQSTFSSASPMVSDAHFITPTDGKVNGIRSNYPHGDVSVASTTTENGSKLGTSAVSGYTGTVFEPIDEFKGDIARMYFYFATRYEDTVSGYSYDMFNGTSDQVFTDAFLAMLLTWNENDPVSARETARNNAIYARQGNRNPFIDNSDYVTDIWGSSSSSSSSTDSTTTTATELFFSEYVEGSSNNKALEITNNTSSSVSLSSYSLKKQTNGSGSWSTALTLSGTLASNAKFVIVNSSISSSCYSTSSANLSTSNTVMTFNGNDPVGLFKDGTLIDIIGTFSGGSSNFAADVTLRRKSTVTGPSTTFSLSSDWDSYSSDTCSNLGSRTSSTDVKESTATDLDSDAISLYPNPSTGNFTISYNNSNIPYTVEIFSLVGQVIFEKKNISETSVQITNIPKGVYVIKITNDSKSISKKMIIN